ncbi:MAG: FCD domain-containing protein [Pseudomonadota bacterium]
MKPALASEDPVFLSLHDAVLSRKIAPDTGLREVLLGTVFGASLSAMRKALKRLRFEGWVRQKRYRGASVVQQLPQEAEEPCAAGKCIEVPVPNPAAETLTSTATRALAQRVPREQAAGSREDWLDCVALSGHFHLLISEIADNRPPKRYSNDLIARGSVMIQMLGRRHHDTCRRNEHPGVLTVLSSGDHDLIARHTEDHVDRLAAGVDLLLRTFEIRPLKKT